MLQIILQLDGDAVTIIAPDGGVATITFSDHVYTSYYQSRLQKPPVELQITDEDWEQLGEGKLYQKDWEGTELTMEMIKDAIGWLILGAESQFPKIESTHPE